MARMPRSLLGVICVLFLSSIQQSQALQLYLTDTDDYYSSLTPSEFADHSQRSTLGQWLHTVLNSGHLQVPGGEVLVENCWRQPSCYQSRSLSYNTARRILFGEIDLKKDDQGYYIDCVYCQDRMRNSEFPAHQGLGENLIPSSNVLNAEHTWPQSRFSQRYSKGTQKSDLHILFPTRARANSSRGNIPFGIVERESDSPCPAAKRGYPHEASSVVFEPPDDHKGNVARALFYFAIRYDLRLSANEEAALRVWHDADPVDDIEIHRHEQIFGHLQVRNPFIDHPEWVREVEDF